MSKFFNEVNKWWSVYCLQNKRFKTPMLRSNLCDYSKAYILVKGRINVTGTTDNVDRRNKKLIFKDNASFRLCISKINNTFIYNA